MHFLFFNTLGVVLLLAAGGSFYVAWAEDSTEREVRAETFAGLAEQLRQEQKLVGLAGMVMVDGSVTESAADGERKTGSGVAVEVGDEWHLGSITKSITATMIARLIEKGQLEWTDTVAEHFPEAAIHEDWRDVTLRQLLTHTSGARANFSIGVRMLHPSLEVECTAERKKAVLAVLAKKPATDPGETFVYSNVGYTIAGAIAEQATGEGWEDLVRREVFEPLELTQAGFGPPKSSTEDVEQPVGHVKAFFWKTAMDDSADNTPIIGPAGTVRMTLKELCTYGSAHLQGELGGDMLLAPETWQELHRPELNNYACGWVKKEAGWEIPHTLYWHNGSNTMWYALLVVIPGKNMVVAVASNDGDIPRAEAAAWELVNLSARKVKPELDAELRRDLPSAAYPKRSPFAAVRWNEDEPEVRIDGDWFKLVSIDGHPTGQLLRFSRERYEEKWRKRFEEDLFELLARMGHEPGETVDLVVQAPDAEEMQTLKEVPMTEENRKAIRAAVQRKEP
ncbi:serine hydrolase domain-containing protein [Rubinisphaera margarita]|uniref:serine hydrolase domain-containing protein n=1 Tax=Rubinisphaera margarita TaxID=2909586 RepID=UPI001EE8C9AF|nr:serine hydrolase domain-containing protein [Rubinisphaera margarita]MCG6157528.1 beta-lactamase family protein [Rubinisphaera margarita]